MSQSFISFSLLSGFFPECTWCIHHVPWGCFVGKTFLLFRFWIQVLNLSYWEGEHFEVSEREVQSWGEGGGCHNMFCRWVSQKHTFPSLCSCGSHINGTQRAKALGPLRAGEMQRTQTLGQCAGPCFGSSTCTPGPVHPHGSTVRAKALRLWMSHPFTQ